MLSRDQNAGADGKVVASRVTRTYQHGHPSEQIVTVALSSGERIECTDNHPFFVPGSGWVPAGKLCLGTQVTPRAGPDAASTMMARVTVVSVVPVAATAGSTVEVFNFEVNVTHTYFVGSASGGEWVHNTCNAQQEASAIRKINNVLRDHLKPGPLGDINGSTLEQLGGQIPKPAGGYYDHIEEMRATLAGLRKNAAILKGSTSPAAQAAYQAAINAIHEIESAHGGLGI